MHRHLLKTRSRMSVTTHAPLPSAATAVPTFNGTAILLVVTHLSLSTPLIITPHPLYRYPSQKPVTAFDVSASVASVDNIFSLSCGPQVCPVVSFLIAFSKNVLNVIINLTDGVDDFPFPPRVQCFLNLANSSSVLLAQIVLAIDALPYHLTVST